MPFVFKVTSSTDKRVQLEAAAPSTPYQTTLITSLTPPELLPEALQLELDLSPLQEGEQLNFVNGDMIRVIALPTPAPTPAKGVKF
jgi:hypothetical protein